MNGKGCGATAREKVRYVSPALCYLRLLNAFVFSYALDAPKTVACLMRFWKSASAPGDAGCGGTAAPPNPIASGLEPLRARFLARLREDHEVLLRYRDAGGTDASELIRVVHRMAGTAGLVGFPAISELAGRLDDELADPAKDFRATLNQLLSLLRTTAFSAQDGPPG